jgi:hypothetical protein
MPPKNQPAKDDTTSKKSQAKADKTYTESAADLAAETRATAEKIREDLDALADKYTELSGTPTEADDAPAMNSARRIPMAIDDTRRALRGLVSAAADVSRTAAR